MDTEIELKLLVPADPSDFLQQTFIPQHDPQAKMDSISLYNSYYDTPECLLRALGMGLRVRGCNGDYEQTIKTAGQAVGGLQQRPEYNVAIEGNNPDLSLFEPDLWPDLDTPEKLQPMLEAIFSTHFERHRWLLHIAGEQQVEVVFDQGEIKSAGYQEPISEIELELKQGDASSLFKLAAELTTQLDCRIGSLSKAARGYMLLNGAETLPYQHMKTLMLNDDDSIEQAFCKACQFALEWWQHHQQSYVETEDFYALKGIVTGIRMLSQAFNLFAEHLALGSFASISADLQRVLQDWQWVDELAVFHSLINDPGSWRKKLDKNDGLLSYLQGRQQGLLVTNQPQHLLNSGMATGVQLAISHMLWQQPWRSEGQGWQQPVTNIAGQMLSASLVSIHGQLSGAEPYDVDVYLQAKPLLRNLLYTGVFLASLFGERSREAFRAPWLDILDGIDELNGMLCLQQEVARSDVDEVKPIQQWCQDKVTRILEVMEKSRQGALSQVPFWQNAE